MSVVRQGLSTTSVGITADQSSQEPWQIHHRASFLRISLTREEWGSRFLGLGTRSLLQRFDVPIDCLELQKISEIRHRRLAQCDDLKLGWAVAVLD